MNKFHIITFVIIIAIFGGILYTTQKDSFGKEASLNQSPSLPPANDSLQFISPPTANQAQQNQQQQQPAQQNPPAELQGPINASVEATIKTSKGNITVILFGKEAQKTVANFITKSKSNYYNNLIFHRVEDWVVQGGDPTGKGNGGAAIQTELNDKPFIAGSLGMAASSQMQSGQGARISNDSQFFIVKKDADWLNGQYTNFGIVIKGMGVVNKIQIGDKILGITIGE
jgi:peptidyl-prolyl cis-trans isomerase B (cyclophilin B)